MAEPEKREKQYIYFVDAKEFKTEKTAQTGGEIKQIAGVPPTYQLFLEEEGDTPDKPISDGESVRMDERIKHLYAVPPATFGAR